MSSGEEIIVKKLHTFYSNYISAIKNLLEIVDEFSKYTMIKLEATYSNDAKIQIEATSLPPIDELYRNSKQRLSDYLGIINSMKQDLLEIRNWVEKRLVPCSDCNGEGRKYIKKYYREKGIVTPYMSSVKCESCDGSGYFKLNRDFAHILSLYLELLLNILSKLFIFNEDDVE